jgi:hypothetical protein
MWSRWNAGQSFAWERWMPPRDTRPRTGKSGPPSTGRSDMKRACEQKVVRSNLLDRIDRSPLAAARMAELSNRR